MHEIHIFTLYLLFQLSEDECEPEQHDLVDRKCDLGPEPGMVDTDDHSPDAKARFNQGNGSMTELTSSHSIVDNGQLLEDGQAHAGNRSTDNTEEKVEQSVVEKPAMLSHDTPGNILFKRKILKILPKSLNHVNSMQIHQFRMTR